MISLVSILILEIVMFYRDEAVYVFWLEDRSNVLSLVQTVIGTIWLIIALQQLKYWLQQIKDWVLQSWKNIKLAEYNTLKNVAYSLKIEIIKITNKPMYDDYYWLSRRNIDMTSFDKAEYLKNEFERIQTKGMKLAQELWETRDI